MRLSTRNAWKKPKRSGQIWPSRAPTIGKHELAADLDQQYDATNTEYKLALASLSTMSSEHLTALQAGNDTASDHELAMQIIANKRYADEQKDAADDAAVLVAEEAKDDRCPCRRDAAHRADLVTALDTHIGIVVAAMETANSDEKLALIGQLGRPQRRRRNAAYAASQTQDRTGCQAGRD